MTIAPSYLRATKDDADTAALLMAYRAEITPATRAFIEGRATGNEFRESWLAYFRGPFLSYELGVQASWRDAYGPDRGIEAGPPHADPRFVATLRLFPVTISHNNLERLVDVLQAELGDNTVDTIRLPERVLDLAFVVDELDRLMSAIAVTD